MNFCLGALILKLLAKAGDEEDDGEWHQNISEKIEHVPLVSANLMILEDHLSFIIKCHSQKRVVFQNKFCISQLLETVQQSEWSSVRGSPVSENCNVTVAQAT